MLPRSLLAAELAPGPRRPRSWRHHRPIELVDEPLQPTCKVMMDGLERIEQHMHPLLGSNELSPGWNHIWDSLESIYSLFKHDEKGWLRPSAVSPWGNMRDLFAELGGPETLMGLLQVCRRLHRDLGLMGLPERWRDEHTGEALDVNERKRLEVRDRIFDVEALCLRTLFKSCFSTLYVAVRLASQKSSISLLFELMRHSFLFADALCVAEELLAVSEETFSLTEVDHFDELIESLTQLELASLCRVLALVVFEPDKTHVESLKIFSSKQLLEKRKSLGGSSVKTTDKNHAILLGCPALLPRLVKLIGSTPGNPWSELGMVRVSARDGESRQPIERDRRVSDTLQQMEGENLPPVLLESMRMAVNMERQLTQLFQDSTNDLWNVDRVMEDLYGFADLEPEDESDFTNRTMPRNVEFGVHSSIQSKYLVQVLFVVCSLLGGRRRADVQETLAECGLVPALLSLCRKLNWKAKVPEQDVPAHAPGCECNPESAMNVQFLRLLHNFCDRDGDDRAIKRLLLSPTERRVIEANWDANKYRMLKLIGWSDSQGAPHEMSFSEESDESADMGADLMADKGLLCMVLDVLISHPAEASYRICLASCLEAYLRGAGRADQLLLAERGLLKYLVDEVSGNAIGLGCMNSLQTSFDLLGELVKFNREVFRMLEEQLHRDESVGGRLLAVATCNLVDSNVFIRSVILSLESFRMEDASTLGHPSSTVDHRRVDFDFASGRLWKFVEANRIRLLHDLMSILQLEDVNQENICCLNTSLVIFIFATACDELEVVLDRAQALQEGNDLRRFETTRNFKSLLGFWKDYYKHRGTDVLSLELSSNIPFSLWRRTVNALCDVL